MILGAFRQFVKYQGMKMKSHSTIKMIILTDDNNLDTPEIS